MIQSCCSRAKYALCVLLLFVASPAWADVQCMANWKCTGSQCAAVMGGYSGQKGPFSGATRAEAMGKCEEWKRSYNSNTDCSCSENGSAGGSDGSIASVVTSSVSRLPPNQALGILGMGIGAAMIGEGLSRLSEEKPAQPQNANAQVAQAPLPQDADAIKSRLISGDSYGLALKGLGSDGTGSQQKGNSAIGWDEK